MHEKFIFTLFDFFNLPQILAETSTYSKQLIKKYSNIKFMQICINTNKILHS